MTDCIVTYFHADDYGVTPRQSEEILSCYEEGALNSISVIANAPQLEKCHQLLEEKDTKKRIRRVLHLNFVEGHSVAPAENIDMLVDKTGYFSCSFMKMLKWNYLIKGECRKQLKEQLVLEIAAQLDRVTQECDYHITAIDSHQHYHMIPIVMESLLEVMEKKKLLIKEIRIPVDPLGPIMATPSLWLKIPFINWIKWGILWLHKGKATKHLKQRKIQTPVFFGIFFTCQMKEKVVARLLPKYTKYAVRHGKSLELMFHPGGLETDQELLDKRSKELREFYMSDNRKREADCLQSMK